MRRYKIRINLLLSILLIVLTHNGCGQETLDLNSNLDIKDTINTGSTEETTNTRPPAPHVPLPNPNPNNEQNNPNPDPNTDSNNEQNNSNPDPNTGSNNEQNNNPSTDPNPSENVPSGDSIAPNVQIKGLLNEQIVSLTVKDEDGNIVDSLQTNYNNQVDLNQLDLKEGNTYTITAETPGYSVAAPQNFTASTESTDIDITFEKIEDNLFHYHWENDFANREYEYSSQAPSPPQIEFLNETVSTPDNASAQILLDDYNIILSNEELTWTQDYTNRLYKIISRIPHNDIQRTKFVLRETHISNDINIETQNSQKIVYISKHAFNNAEPRLVRFNGARGRFFSHRLFHALVYFYTNGGQNRRAVTKILQDKFNLSLTPPNIQTLTGEHPDNFQAFHHAELLDIIIALAEMPEGYYEVPGLRYFLRRKDGHPHPLYPEAPAVAWPRGANSDSYVEFMDSAFRQLGDVGVSNDQTRDYIHRLILHEKTHFIYRNVLSEKLRQEWISIAGWYENANDPDGWSNKYTTSFVSPYAHKKNPNEDMAETVSYYILNPNKLKSVAPAKFDFIKNHIMSGYEYVLQVREDLQFEVLNLFPDYDYPGKIKRVDVYARGAKDEDKNIEVEIELLNKEGFEDGAKGAITRIFSPNGTFIDMRLYPVNGNEHILKGTAKLSKYAKAGYWKVDQITVTDEHNNDRMEGVDDFGFKLYINNQTEDTTPPKYVKDSLEIQVTPITVKGRQVHRVTIEWDIEEDMEMQKHSGVYVNFVSLDYPEAYALQKYGNVNLSTNRAKVVIDVTEYFPAGKYTVAYLRMQDKALNSGSQYFSQNNPNHEASVIVNIQTTNHDTIKPTLDVNRISVTAAPVNPDNPDGQTNVTITYYAKDDKSGIGLVNYVLINPTGRTFFEYHYHSNFYTQFFEGDPTAYRKYVIHHTLPKGSAPGTWGLKEMNISDKGGNTKNYNFTEVMHFSLENDE